MYDPLTGQFMQQDPAAQFQSPYAYGPGDPLNGTDPTGASFIAAIVGFLFSAQGLVTIAVAGVLANALYTGITTGSIGAGVLGLAIGFGQLVLGGLLIAPIAQPVMNGASTGMKIAIGTVGAGWSGYSTAKAIKSGNVVGAISGALNLAMAALGVVALKNKTVAEWVSGDTAATQGNLSCVEASAGRHSPDSRWVGGTQAQMEAVVAAQNGAFQNPILNALGKLWALPSSIVGGTLGVLGIPFGARPQFGNNAIEFLNFPFGPDGALTLGNVILYRNTVPNTVDVFYGVSQLLGRHELAHTFQAQVLGPFYLPGYVASGGFPSASHPIESAATNFAKFRGGFWP